VIIKISLWYNGGSAILAGATPALVHVAPSAKPKGKAPREVVLVYWTVDGDEPAVLEIIDVWKKDTGVPVRWERTPNIEETFQKVLSMNLADEQCDVTVMNNFNMAKWVKEDVVQALDGLPGLDDYLKQMYPAA
jgi:spermidine/putrescine-binding protein